MDGLAASLAPGLAAASGVGGPTWHAPRQRVLPNGYAVERQTALAVAQWHPRLFAAPPEVRLAISYTAHRTRETIRWMRIAAHHHRVGIEVGDRRTRWSERNAELWREELRELRRRHSAAIGWARSLAGEG